MNKVFFAIMISILSGSIAYAGSSSTTLACSSESGRTVISGLLPGQGQMEIQLNVSVADDMMIYSNGEMNNDAEAEVILNAKKQRVEIRVWNAYRTLTIKSAAQATTNLRSSNSGTAGSFIGLVTGTHPGTHEAIKQPIAVRCFVSDRI